MVSRAKSVLNSFLVELVIEFVSLVIRRSYNYHSDADMKYPASYAQQVLKAGLKLKWTNIFWGS